MEEKWKYRIKEICDIDEHNKLNTNNIENRYKEFINDSSYKKDEELIQTIFKKFPHNNKKDIEIVALKICLIDVTNSTHLSQKRKQIVVSDLANHIVTIKDFDKRVKNGDPKLVNELAKCNKITLKSFASKYCAYHNRYAYNEDKFSIIDGNVEKVLPKYVDISRGLKENTFNDYEQFDECISYIIKNVEGLNIIDDARKKLDIFFWSQLKNLNNKVENNTI